LATDTPFQLGNQEAYRRWRDRKLGACPGGARSNIIEIENLYRLTPAELCAVKEACRETNMAVYACLRHDAGIDKEAIRAFGRQLGLLRFDRTLCADGEDVASVEVLPDGPKQEYIPYTNRPINWHTDGYYNDADHQVRGVLMHCVSPAASGGDSTLLDPEIVYIWLRDENPDYVAGLMQTDVMTIPANVEDGRVLRPESSGPVFSLDVTGSTLHMRYTARKRFVVWKDDPLTQEAVQYLQARLSASRSRQVKLCLQRGQGVVCNNVLHARRSFVDGPEKTARRRLFRARYLERVAET
jgi:hypothetical protein